MFFCEKTKTRMTEVDKVEAIEYLISYDENIGDKWRKVEKLITEITYLLT